MRNLLEVLRTFQGLTQIKLVMLGFERLLATWLAFILQMRSSRAGIRKTKVDCPGEYGN